MVSILVMKTTDTIIKEMIEKKIEEVLRNRILYIGNEIPDYFTIEDKRDKQVYLGFPQQLIDELTTLFSEALKEGKEGVSQDICKIINDIELSYRDTSLEEWKAFKHIRNAIRDKYEPTSYQRDTSEIDALSQKEDI